MSLNFWRTWCLTCAFPCALQPRTVISAEKAYHEQISVAEITMSVLQPASLTATCVPHQKKNCVVVSCTNVTWCRKMSALRRPSSKRSGPFSFLSGHRRASSAGSITSLRQWGLEGTWQSVESRAHDAEGVFITRKHALLHTIPFSIWMVSSVVFGTTCRTSCSRRSTAPTRTWRSKENAQGPAGDMQAGTWRERGGSCQSALFSVVLVFAVTTQRFCITPNVVSD